MSADEHSAPVITREMLENAVRQLRNPTKVYYTSQRSRQEMIKLLEKGLVDLNGRDSMGLTAEQKEEQ